MNLFEARAAIRGVVAAAKSIKSVAADYVEAVPLAIDASGTFLMAELLSKRIGATMGADVTGDPAFGGAKQASGDGSRERVRDDTVETVARDVLHKFVTGSRGKVLRRAVGRGR